MQITRDSGEFFLSVIFLYFRHIKIDNYNDENGLKEIKLNLSNLNKILLFYLATLNRRYYDLRIWMINKYSAIYLRVLKEINTFFLPYLAFMDGENKSIKIKMNSKALSFVEYLYNYICLYIVNYKSIEYTNLCKIFCKFEKTFYIFLSQYNINDPHLPDYYAMVKFDFNNLIDSFQAHIFTLDDDKRKQDLNYALKYCVELMETYFSTATSNPNTSNTYQNIYHVTLDYFNCIDTNDVIDYSVQNVFKYTWQTLKNYLIQLESWSNWSNKQSHEIINEKDTCIYELALVYNVIIAYVYTYKKLCGDETNLELGNFEEILFCEIFNLYSLTHNFLVSHIIDGEILEDQMLQIKLLKIDESLMLIIRSLKTYLSKLVNIKYKKEQEDIINVLDALKSPLLTYLRILCCIFIKEN
ncbi:hypothetical protein EDEG_02115 [Edhazardia aedis USNM 41457]|uniref:Uncharacterized protein n=1 Tax=Edhazardia aedis (strain USNM 41457) TaxID=1003232 RepID=J9D720_EDHAE|nr:hypothetical protein EDEG_02115 [Edhazardia aedis USNM 41457]|eukprot:EJW03561.1 hypothetical protein EDEG_02115 [Edhazardia aedis USNM 41457]